MILKALLAKSNNVSLRGVSDEAILKAKDCHAPFGRSQ